MKGDMRKYKFYQVVKEKGSEVHLLRLYIQLSKVKYLIRKDEEGQIKRPLMKFCVYTSTVTASQNYNFLVPCHSQGLP